jgi:hypothetical protein
MNEQKNEMIGWLNCPFCGAPSGQHRVDCKGLQPGAKRLRQLYGQPWPEDRQPDEPIGDA